MTINKYSVVTLLVFVIVTGLVFQAVFAAVTGPEAQEFFNESSTWCEEHNGTLVNSNSFIHGGLHCRFENGSSVHMNEVVSIDE